MDQSDRQPAEATLTPHRVAVLLNTYSGGNYGRDRDQLRHAVQSAFEKRGISADCELLSGAELGDGARRALARAIQGELDAVIVGGGDGSIRTVASVLAGSGISLGILPMGTLNHFAKDLHIPLSVDEAVAVIAAGKPRLVDVGEVNGRRFVNNSSIGVYPYLVLERERRRRRQGLSKWSAMILAGLRALRNLPIRRLTIRAEHWVESCRSPCVFVGNNEYRITGLSLGTRTRLDGGQLCLYIATQQNFAALLWLACRCVLGLLDPGRDLRMFNVANATISSRHRRLLVAFDGEVEAIGTPLHYRVKPGALRVFAPSAPATDG